MDAEVARLHEWARQGAVDHCTAEAHIHSYLAAAAHLRADPGGARTARMLVMRPEDAPQFGTLPDLGRFVRAALLGEEPRDFTAALVAQSLPCLRRAHRFLPGVYSAGLNLLLGLLLGVYFDVGRRPPFAARVSLYARVHALLTAEPAAQEAFAQQHHHLLLLAAMEYMARVLPALMPTEYDFLASAYGMAGFFEKTPLHCDEMRELDGTEPWAALEARAQVVIERSARVKRRPARGARGKGLQVSPEELALALECPALAGAPEEPEWRMLAHAYALPPAALRRAHGLVRVVDLPWNIRERQLDSLRVGGRCQRQVWGCTRLRVCLACLASRDALHHDFRVDTLSGALLCSDCHADGVVALDMLGRAACLAGQTYVFCSACCSVHAYRPTGEWPERCCLAAPAPPPSPAPRCSVCGDSHVQSGLDRVDHLTGRLALTHYCARHAPRLDAAAMCVNVRQLVALEARTRTPFYMPKRPALGVF